MSDYHVLEGNKNGTTYSVAFHIAVPAEFNKSSTSTLQTALTEDPRHTASSIVPHINASETAALISGTLFEHVESYGTHEDHTKLADQTALDDRYTLLNTIVPDKLRNVYAFWKFDRNVP